MEVFSAILENVEVLQSPGLSKELQLAKELLSCLVSYVTDKSKEVEKLQFEKADLDIQTEDDEVIEVDDDVVDVKENGEEISLTTEVKYNQESEIIKTNLSEKDNDHNEEEKIQNPNELCKVETSDEEEEGSKPGSKDSGNTEQSVSLDFLYCKFCDFQQDIKDEFPVAKFKIHSKEIHRKNENHFKCTAGGCDFTCMVMTTMVGHIQSIHNGIWFNCDECLKKFARVSKLKKHKESHTKRKERVEKRIQKENARIGCIICGKLLKYTTLDNHMKVIHSNGPKFYCSSCEYSTKDPYSLKNHEQLHSEKQNCTKCDFSCGQDYAMKRHMRSKHEGGEIYLCSFCDYKCAFPKRLENHEESHSERNLPCDKCDFKAKGSESLKRHIQRHEPPKLICNQCDYKTNDSANFSKHKVVKHGNILLKCVHCEYGTKSKRSLRQHSLKHIDKQNRMYTLA